MTTPLQFMPKKLNIDIIDNYKLIRSAELRSSKGEKVFLETFSAEDEYNDKVFTTYLFDSGKNFKAYNSFNINQQTQIFNGHKMKVNNPEERMKNGYGEILRLSSVIELLENNLNRIAIFAKSQAVLFHYKYKLRPQITYEETESFLDRLSAVKAPELAQVRNKASALFNDYFMDGQGFGAKHNYQKETIKLLNEYLQTVEDKHLPWKSGLHSRGLELFQDVSMYIDKEAVLKNKDFFNTLFEKHDFDYRI